MAEIKEKAEKPEGVLPKNIQTYVILGISAILVAIVVFSGSGSKKKQEKVEIKPTYATKTEDIEKTKQLESEIQRFKKELEKQQEIIRRQNAMLQSKGNYTPAPANSGVKHFTNSSYSSYSEEIRKDLERRRYKSLFTSNVALSYRKPADEYSKKNEQVFNFERPKKAVVGTPTVSSTGDERELSDAEIWRQIQGEYPTPTQQEKTPQRGNEAVKRASLEQTQPTGKYKVSAGTIIETVLLNRLVGDFSGPVKVMVSTPVYSNNFQHLLIPKGTIILGQAKKVQVFGQERLAVSFNRLIFPNNKSISLNQFTGLDQIGATGLKDKVNYHYLRIFGASIMLGLISGWANSTVDYGYAYSGSDAYRSGVADSISRSAIRILDKFLNIMPTITIREGHRVKVFLSDDLYLNEY